MSWNFRWLVAVAVAGLMAGFIYGGGTGLLLPILAVLEYPVI